MLDISNNPLTKPLLKERDFSEIGCKILPVGIKVAFDPGTQDLYSFGEGVPGLLCGPL